MEQTKYIAAIDPGTSTIRAMAAHKYDGNVLSIIAAEQADSDNCIRRGYVYNINETSAKIASLITALGRKLPSPVAKVYLGIGGQSIHSMPYTVKKEITEERVTKELIDSLLEECKSYQPEHLEVLDIVSPEYQVDGRFEPNPVGVIGNSIEAHFQLILGRPSLKSNLKKCIPEGGKYSIAGYFITPLATAEAVLTGEEKQLGCALVEFGAGVTYVSVYKNGHLQLLSTIPLGGDVITKDIQSMNFLQADAERLKVGDRLEGREIDENKLAEIISIRSEEIVANVIEQLSRWGNIGDLGVGVIITGGASRLADMDEFLMRKLENTPIRMALTRKTLVNNMSEVTREPANTAIVGLLSLGTENCAKVKEVIKSPEPEVPVDLFGAPIVEPPKKEPGKRKPQPPKEPKGRGIRDWFSKAAGQVSDSLFGEEETGNDNEDKE